MVRRVVWTKRATNNFDKIINYLEGEWGTRVTQMFVRRTYALIDLIAEKPDLGTVENPDKKIRGFLLTRHNRVFYRVTEEEIILLNFFDTRSGTRRKKF